MSGAFPTSPIAASVVISTNQTKRDEAYEKLINDIFKYVR